MAQQIFYLKKQNDRHAHGPICAEGHEYRESGQGLYWLKGTKKKQCVYCTAVHRGSVPQATAADPSPQPRVETVALSRLHIDPLRVQPRVTLDQAKVQEYAELYSDQIDLGPILVYAVACPGGAEALVVVDGFHRVAAKHRIAAPDITANVRHGTMRDAVLAAAQANRAHGVPLTNADKHRVVMRLLDDEEWRQWSDREIARHCGVSNTFVSTCRSSLSTVDSEGNFESVRAYHTRHGTTATMNTENIGRQDTVRAAASTALNTAEPQECVAHQPVTVNGTTTCKVCHRVLTHPASMQRGIGPVCAGGGSGPPRGGSGGIGGGGVVAARQAYEQHLQHGYTLEAIRRLARITDPQAWAAALTTQDVLAIESALINLPGTVQQLVQAWQQRRAVVQADQPREVQP